MSTGTFVAVALSPLLSFFYLLDHFLPVRLHVTCLFCLLLLNRPTVSMGAQNMWVKKNTLLLSVP